MSSSDYSFHDENNAFICPENVAYGLGLVRNGGEVFVSLTDSEGEGAHTPLTVEQASLAGRELLRLSASPVYESPEELAAEITRLRRENAALQQLATRAEKDVATLTADRDRALEESAAIADRVAARLVEEEQAVQKKILADPTNPSLAGLLVGLQRARDIATEVVDGTRRVLRTDPAPRDTELTQQVRALVKRYGAPNVAYEAARQAGRH